VEGRSKRTTRDTLISVRESPRTYQDEDLIDGINACVIPTCYPHVCLRKKSNNLVTYSDIVA
jgi:hypothetical protein